MSAGAVPVPEDDGGDLSPPPGYEYEPSAEEEFADFQRWRRERGSRRGARRTARRDDEDEGEDDQFRTNAGPPPTWDGTSSPFEDYLIRAKIWCSTTKARPRTRGPLLLKALAETPFQDFKHLAKDSSWLNDINNAEVLLDKMNSPEYYGDDQEEHLLSALSRLTYHLKRQRQETARQFLARWETAERKAKEHKVDLPSVYRGFLLINALGLSEGDIKALLNYTHGSIEPKEIRTWLRKHETKLQANQLGTDGQSTKTRTSTTASSTSSAHLMEDAKTGDYKEEPDEVEEMEAFLADLEGSETENYDEIGTLEEAETAEILSVMLKERKKKTFVQSNQLKKEKELSRGYGQRGQAHHGGPVRPGIYRLSISELKKRPSVIFRTSERVSSKCCLLVKKPFQLKDSNPLPISYLCGIATMEGNSGKRARAEPQPQPPLWVRLWGNMVVKLLIFVRPVLRMMQNLCRPGPMEEMRTLRQNWEEIPLSCLSEVHEELGTVLKNRRRERGAPPSPQPLRERGAPSSPQPTTPGASAPGSPPSFNSLGPTASPQSQPRGPPPPVPMGPAVSSSRASRARHRNSSDSETSSTGGYELVEPVMEMINEKLVDRSLQDRIMTNGAQVIFKNIPMCHCGHAAGIEVTLKTGPNYQKVFLRCYNPPGKHQCRFFAWPEEQPLRDETHRMIREQVQEGGKSSPRELLCQVIQAKCEHRFGTINSGTNQHYVMKRCRICQKMMERYRRPPAQKTIREDNQDFDTDREDYEAWKEDFAQQCQKFHVTAALLLPDVPSGLRDSNSKDQYFRWSVSNPEAQTAFEGVCPDGLMKRNMAHRLIGAAVAVLYTTTVDQIYQYYLGAVDQTHRETKFILRKQFHEKITPQGVPRGNLKEIYANEDEGVVFRNQRKPTEKYQIKNQKGVPQNNVKNKSFQANHEVIEIARNLKCSVCSRFAQTRPQRRAAPPREYGLNEVVGLDTLWLPYLNGRKTLALNVIDWSSHFQLIIPVKTANPEAIWIAFQQWIRLFGPPKQVYVDQGPEFKGSFRNRVSREGIHMEPSSLESPFQRGVTERHGKTFKVMLSKAMNEVSCDAHKTWQALVDNVIMMKNRLANRGGFSPIQRVFGYYPRLPGGLMSSDIEDPRKAAAKAFFATDCDQALRNALSAGPRPQIEYHVGQMVYFYRIGHSKKGRTHFQNIKKKYQEKKIKATDHMEVIKFLNNHLLYGTDDGPEPSQSSWESLPRTRPHEELPDDETPGPPAKKSRTELLEIYYAKLETLMKTRQRKEVRLKELNQHDLDCFIRAAEKEIKNNLETQAYEILGPEESQRVRTEKPERIMDSRFVRTAKPLEESDLDKARAEGLLLAGEHGGPCKAKVRHVMKGFSENGAEELDAATPQVTRDGVIAVTQMIAGQGWRLGFLDFTQAFHSGDPISRELYAEKTCYGLLDGPMAWFQHLRRVLTQELGYTQSVVDPCIYYLHNKKETGWKSLEGIISVATDDMLHGGGAEHQAKMEYLNKTYKLGKFQYGEGRFTGKNFKPLPCGGVLIEQDHYVKEKIETISITRVRKSQRYSMCNEKEIGELRSLVGGLAWLAKETRPDLCGRVCLLQQAFPRPRVRDLIQANQLANEAMKYPAGIKVSKIPLERIRISTVTDASWGNAAEPMTGKDPDYWVETQDQWIRYHVRPRRTLFHPGMTDDGPDIHQLSSQRRTHYQCDGPAQLHADEWAHPNKVKLLETGPWVGKTIFDKGATTEANIHEGFLQNRRLSSQGGHIILYHDKDLQYEPWAKVTVASWKSYKLKRKVVNTLAAECQALVSGVGNLQWHRFLFAEAQNDPIKDRDWERKLSNIPFLAVTDSKSLYDTLSKQTCPFSQVDDKRTAIDVSILKHDLEGAGTVRWIDGRNMISDNLTKNAGGNYLRFVMSRGQWTLNEQGFTELEKNRTEASQECFFLCPFLWGTGFAQKKFGPV
ncbi:RE1 [Symbiodinium sp. KB8]|nr:RE1 [Symbiodinium sp. KB8]